MTSVIVKKVFWQVVKLGDNLKTFSLHWTLHIYPDRKFLLCEVHVFQLWIGW